MPDCIADDKNMYKQHMELRFYAGHWQLAGLDRCRLWQLPLYRKWTWLTIICVVFAFMFLSICHVFGMLWSHNALEGWGHPYCSGEAGGQFCTHVLGSVSLILYITCRGGHLLSTYILGVGALTLYMLLHKNHHLPYIMNGPSLHMYQKIIIL